MEGATREIESRRKEQPAHQKRKERFANLRGKEQRVGRCEPWSGAVYGPIHGKRQWLEWLSNSRLKNTVLDLYIYLRFLFAS